MAPVVVFVVGILGGALLVVVAALVAWARTGRHTKELQQIEERLAQLTNRVQALESTGARQARTDAVAPAPAATPSPASAPAPTPTPRTVDTYLPSAPAPTSSPLSAAPAPVSVPAAAVTPIPSAASDAVEPRLSPAPPPARPVAPRPPNPVTQWLLRGNPLAKLGVVLMFFGLAYLLKFASDRGLLPIELRLAGAAFLSTGLLFVGWRLRTLNPTYGLTLQGGAIGALYLTSFAAFRVYSLVPHGLAFALLVIICAASVMLAVLQRAQSLALLASLGGFAAPIVLSTGGGNHVALFSYYALLSAGILAVSIWQTWRPVNLVGFVFTFGVGTLWGLDSYRPEFYWGAQFFLILNLLIYGVIAVFASTRRSDNRGDPFIDGTLAFGSPLIGFGLQAGLTRHWEYGPAFSALAFGAFYLGLTWLTLRRSPERLRRLTTVFLALGGGFVTLAIPLALSARFTAMAWALEGLGVLWVGRAQRHGRMIASGTGLLLLAATAATGAWLDGLDTPTFVLVAAVLSLTWMAGARLWTMIEIGEERGTNKWVSNALLLGGVAAWLLLLVEGSDRTGWTRIHETMLALAAMGGTALAWSVVASKLRWTPLGECGLLLWPFAAMTLEYQVGLAGGHPVPFEWQSLAWVVAFAAAWRVLRWGQAMAPDREWRAVFHAAFVWLAFAVAFREAEWRLDRLGWGQEEWKVTGLLILSFACIVPIRQMARRQHWAVTTYPKAYWAAGLLPPMLVGGTWLLAGNVLDGRTPDLPYAPVLNPLEQAAAFGLLMLVVWARALSTAISTRAAAIVTQVAIAGVIWWTNGLLLRTLATVGGVTWSIDGLWHSTLVQTSMAIAWSAAALVAMALGARRAHRQAWFGGAAALGVVVVKLFLVDSARGGGLARAVAFIGVALLVLIIGYMAPLPPRDGQEEGTPS